MCSGSDAAAAAKAAASEDAALAQAADARAAVAEEKAGVAEGRVEEAAREVAAALARCSALEAKVLEAAASGGGREAVAPAGGNSQGSTLDGTAREDALRRAGLSLSLLCIALEPRVERYKHL